MRKRYIQDPETHELIPAELYKRPVRDKAFHVMPDIKPFKSVCGDIAGQEISSRSKLREFEKRNGLVQVGSDTSYYEKPDPEKQRKAHRESISHDLHRAWRDLNA